MTDTDPDITATDLPTAQPGWSREAIHRGGDLIGYLDRHEAQQFSGRPGLVRWLPCTPRWDAVGDRARGFDTRDAALAALIEAVES